MRKTTLIIFLFLVIANSKGQNYILHWQYCKQDDEISFDKTENKIMFFGDKLNGKIKIITQNIYNKRHTDSTDMIYEFNQNGLIIKRNILNQSVTYDYDTKNRLLKKKFAFLDCGSEYGNMQYFYNNEGNLSKTMNISINNDNSKNSDTTHYFYNRSNKLIEEKGNLQSIKWIYDQNDNCINCELYERNQLIKKIENKFNNNRIIETFIWQLFEDEEHYYKNKYIYNDDKSLKSIIKNSSYTSDFQNSKSSTIFFEYTYDNKKRLTKLKETDGENHSITTFSNYDKNDNWTKKHIYGNGEDYIIERRFIYFED